LQKKTITPTEYGLFVLLVGAASQSGNTYIATDKYIGFYGDVHVRTALQKPQQINTLQILINE
jgi:hypothetical protein